MASSDPQGRILVAIARRGLAFSDDGGTTFTWLNGLAWPVTGETVQGATTLARAPGTNAVYALTGLRRTSGLPKDVDDDTALFRVPDLVPTGGAAPAASRVRGVPVRLWPGQRDYDQALDVDVVAVGADPAVHRVYLGGSYTDGGQRHLRRQPVVLRRRRERPPGPGAGCLAARPPRWRGGCRGRRGRRRAHRPGGARRRARGPAGRRLSGDPVELWVGCDGGVYVSAAAGRALTFSARCTGLATLEAGFSAAHPTSSHLVAAGLQDNGTQVRVGDTVWEELFQGDGGGIVVDPAQPHRLVGQYIRASWSAEPAAGFVSPTSRIPGGGATDSDRENGRAVSSFYSGGAAVRTAAGTTRLAVGTNRVWLSDDLGSATPNTWRVLRFPSGAPLDARPHGTDPADRRRFGVPAGALGIPPAVAGAATGPLGRVVTLRWADATTLLVLFQFGVVRWTETAPGAWQAAFLVDWAALPGNLVLTDVAPVPGGQDLYVSTTGDAATPGADTCYLYDAASGTTTATALRTALAPLDPAYAVAVDPASTGDVYVGTVTGVWHGIRTAGATTVTWDPTPFVNGLPQAAVQDLAVHHDPAHPGVRLLRAAVQSRGVWEVDLAAATEPVRTYLRVHAYDDRRRLPTSLTDVRRPPAAPPLSPAASPDIAVRPESAAQVAPQWQARRRHDGGGQRSDLPAVDVPDRVPVDLPLRARHRHLDARPRGAGASAPVRPAPVRRRLRRPGAMGRGGPDPRRPRDRSGIDRPHSSARRLPCAVAGRGGARRAGHGDRPHGVRPAGLGGRWHVAGPSRAVHRRGAAAPPGHPAAGRGPGPRRAPVALRRNPGDAARARRRRPDPVPRTVRGHRHGAADAERLAGRGPRPPARRWPPSACRWTPGYLVRCRSTWTCPRSTPPASCCCSRWSGRTSTGSPRRRSGCRRPRRSSTWCAGGRTPRSGWCRWCHDRSRGRDRGAVIVWTLIIPTG